MMGRWTQYDDDDYRLPEGMQRIGYDADTQQYTYKDTDGSLWIGAPGNRYGELTKIKNGRSHGRSRSVTLPVAHSRVIEVKPEEIDEEINEEDLEASAPSKAGGYHLLPTGDTEESLQPKWNLGPYSTLLPFFLIVAVFLLLVLRVVTSSNPPLATSCPAQAKSYTVKAGDNCWAISEDFETTLEELQSLNPDIDCSILEPGQMICIPTSLS